MDLKHLDYFLSVAETLNFTEAAKDCSVSQAAISLGIAKIEKELGFLLFERNNRVVHLTPAGDVFCKWAIQMKQEYLRVVNCCKDIDHNNQVIHVGFGSCFEALWLLPDIQQYKNKTIVEDSDICFEQTVLDHKALLPALMNKEVDAVISPSYQKIDRATFAEHTIGTFPLVAAVGKQNPLAKLQEIPLSILKQQKFVMIESYKNTKFESAVVEFCWKNDIHFTEVRNLSRIEDVALFLANNDYITLVPSVFSDYIGDITETRWIANSSETQVPFSWYHLKNDKKSDLQILDEILYLKEYSLNKYIDIASNM